MTEQDAFDSFAGLSYLHRLVENRHLIGDRQSAV
jgi:hypothetical protein